MAAGQHATGEKGGILRSFVSLLIMIAFVLGLSWALRTYVFTAYEIPSGSMEETIMPGDMVYPEIPGRTLIKRCIATAGQTIDIDGDGFLYIDGVAQTEIYTNNKPTLPLTNSNITFPYTVPSGCIWVMGDNRTNSQDSRYFGAVPISSVSGRGVLVYWPVPDFGLLE